MTPTPQAPLRLSATETELPHHGDVQQSHERPNAFGPYFYQQMRRIEELTADRDEWRRRALAPKNVPSESPSEAEADAVFVSGAKRSEIKPAYRLIPPEFTERLARRYSEGAAKYGSLNYFRGLADPQFVEQLIDHLEAHLNAFKTEGCVADDNLAAIGWGVATLCVVEQHVPEMLLMWRKNRSDCIASAQESLQDTDGPDYFTGAKTALE